MFHTDKNTVQEKKFKKAEDAQLSRSALQQTSV